MSDPTMLAVIARVLEKYDIVDGDLTEEIEAAVYAWLREDDDGE